MAHTPSRADRIEAIALQNHFQSLGLKAHLQVFEDESFTLDVIGLPGNRGFLLSSVSPNRRIGTREDRYWFFFRGTDADDRKPWTYTRDFASARAQLVDLVNIALYGRAQALRMRPLVAGSRAGAEPLPLPGGLPRKNPAKRNTAVAGRMVALANMLSSDGYPVRFRSSTPRRVDAFEEDAHVEFNNDEWLISLNSYARPIHKRLGRTEITKAHFEVRVFDKRGGKLPGAAVAGRVKVQPMRSYEDAQAYFLQKVFATRHGRAGAMRMRDPGEYRLPLPGGRSRKNPAVMPVRASNMAKFNLPMQRGGVYLEPRSRADLTGHVYAGGFIDVTGPRPTFIASDAPDTMPDRRGRLVTKVNLFKQLGKWRWVGAGRPTSVIEDTPVLVSVQNTHGHFYALRVDFETPMQLATYPQQRDEPRLRPTAHAREMTTGHTVGEIVTNARSRHAVYDRITLR